MSVPFVFSALAVILFVIKTTLLPAAGLFAHVHIFLLLTTYLGFEHSLASGTIPVLIMGILDSTFSGASSIMIIFGYGLAFILCFVLQHKTNFVLTLYRMLAVLLLGMVTGIIFVGLSSLGGDLKRSIWIQIISMSVLSALLCPVFFRIFKGIEGVCQKLVTREKPKEGID